MVSDIGMSPVAFVRSILCERGEIKIETTMNKFVRPTEQEMAAYNNDVVGAIRKRNVAKLREFVQQGVQLQCCNRFGESLLHMACRRGFADVVQFLLEEAKVSPFKKDDFGRTPLHDACWTTTPNLELMELLLKASEPQMLLVQDVRGHTPLDYSRREHWEAWINFFSDRKELLLKSEPGVELAATTEGERTVGKTVGPVRIVG